MHAFRVYKSTVLYCTVKNAFRVRTVPSESYGPAFYLAKGMSRESMPVSSSPPTPLKLHVHRPEYQALPNLKLHKSISIATFPPAIMLQTPYVVLVIILVHHCCKQILPLIRNKEGGGGEKEKKKQKTKGKVKTPRASYAALPSSSASSCTACLAMTSTALTLRPAEPSKTNGPASFIGVFGPSCCSISAASAN